MPPDPQVFLHDILSASEALARFTRGRSLEDYLSDEVLQAAVERKFGIIGEAIAQLSRAAPEVAARIPDRSRIVAFRNILIHGYANVNPATVWDVLENDLSRLIAIVRTLLPPPGSPP